MANTLMFGDKLPSSGDRYLRVKEKGDQIQFRIAHNPVYIGQHFFQKETGWEVMPCARINKQEECDSCEQYFILMKDSKNMKDTDLKQSEALKNEARNYQCSISFYFPVLNRDTKLFGILKTTMGVRNKINEFFENGTNILEKDFILRNTGEKGKGRYSVTIVDSADTAKLTPEETAELDKARAFDMNSINEGESSEDEIE